MIMSGTSFQAAMDNTQGPEQSLLDSYESYKIL